MQDVESLPSEKNGYLRGGYEVAYRVHRPNHVNGAEVDPHGLRVVNKRGIAVMV